MIFRRVYRLVFELSHAEQLAQWCEYRARLQGLSPRCRAVGIAACIRIVCGLCDAVQSTCSLPLRYQESTPARRADVPACFALSAWFLSGSSNACNSKQPVRHLPATAERACSAQVRCRTLRASRSPVVPNQVERINEYSHSHANQQRCVHVEFEQPYPHACNLEALSSHAGP